MELKTNEKHRRALHPDEFADTIYDITPELLDVWKIKVLICDIDNTLVPYDVPSADENLVEHLKNIEKSGVKIAFVSNNNKERVDLFNEPFGFFANEKSGKPFGKGIRRCIKHFNVDKKNIVLVGDQLFTDVLGAHDAGIKAILVPPIKEKENTFFKIKRMAEKPFLKYFKRKRAKEFKK